MNTLPLLRSLAVTSLGLAALALPGVAQSNSATFSNLVDGYIEVPYDATVVPQAGLTIEAWVTYDETPLPTGYRYPTIVRQNGNAGQESFFLRVEAGQTKATALRFLINTAGTGVRDVNWNFGPGGLLSWTHVAGTYDGTTMRLYVDGVEVGSNAASGPLVDNGDPLRIGKGSDVGTPNEVWSGAIDAVRLWPFARTGAEIRTTRSLEMWSLPGKVSTWNLDGDGLDSSGANNGAIFGQVQFTPPAPALSSALFPGVAFGASSPGCFGPIDVTVGSLPKIGSPIFSLVGHQVTPGVTAFGYVGFSSLGAPFPILGIDVWVDPVGALGLFPASVGTLGDLRLNIPIPAGLPPGLAATVQLLAFEPCGPQGLAASNGIGFALIP